MADGGSVPEPSGAPDFAERDGGGKVTGGAIRYLALAFSLASLLI